MYIYIKDVQARTISSYQTPNTSQAALTCTRKNQSIITMGVMFGRYAYLVIQFTLLAQLLPACAQEFNINNYCKQDVYFWDVGANSSPPTLLPLNDFRQTHFGVDPVTKGKDIFISYSNTSDISQPTLHISYNIDGDWKNDHVLWYSMANLNGAMFKGHQVKLWGPTGVPGTDTGCERLNWEDGEGDQGVKNCPGAKWLDLNLCPDTLGT
jgi:hypothetical protein